jgi:iron complex outermembrane receptor protein
MILNATQPIIYSQIRVCHWLNRYLRPLFLLLLLSTASAVFAQQTVRGKITGEGGAAITGATVQVKGTRTATQTDATGSLLSMRRAMPP